MTQLKISNIIKRLGITRQAFYKNNEKHKVFKKLSRGLYEVDETILNQMEKYYELKGGFNLWECVIPKEK